MLEKYVPPKEILLLIVIGWYLFNLLVSNSMWVSIILGFSLVFLVPGYSWVDSLVKTEDQIERFVLAVALSISLVILSIVWMNLIFKIQITKMSVFVDIALISIAGMIWENRKIMGFSGKGSVSPKRPQKRTKKRKKSRRKSKK
jgi:uncharacterized membrane protein